MKKRFYNVLPVLMAVIMPGLLAFFSLSCSCGEPEDIAVTPDGQQGLQDIQADYNTLQKNYDVLERKLVAMEAKYQQRGDDLQECKGDLAELRDDLAAAKADALSKQQELGNTKAALANRTDELDKETQLHLAAAQQVLHLEDLLAESHEDYNALWSRLARVDSRKDTVINATIEGDERAHFYKGWDAWWDDLNDDLTD